jgi:hypothetical protein
MPVLLFLYRLSNSAPDDARLSILVSDYNIDFGDNW